MALKYLLDTNTISEPTRSIVNKTVEARLRAAQGMMAIAATTWHEMLFGLHRMPASHKRNMVQSYLSSRVAAITPILPYDEAAAAWFAAERARLVSIGRTPSYSDGQIAAVAVSNNLIIVTRNAADFADFQGVQVENWFEPSE